jgi:hypothetical protein
MNAPDNCFVVMPFGRKPIPDSAGRVYDFDKVYRVIIQRAIRQAGLEPVRADERQGSHMVHAEMFADLRDHPVVLADLSLLNPNVFYELGIRHVMSPSGTVLMCRQGTVLPFDVNLSRVIFYDFDGESLDWEVVETVVQRVQAGLENAKRRQPDSPVHALLGHVLSGLGEGPEAISEVDLEHRLHRITNYDTLDEFQKELALFWKQAGAKWEAKAAEHAQSPFGLRAAAHLALATEASELGNLGELPHQLYSLEQYDLANVIFETKKNQEGLGLRDTLRYGSSLSEADPSLVGIERGWKVLQSALAKLDPKASPEDATPKQARDAAGAHYCVGSFLAWKWRSSNDEADLAQSIQHLSDAQRWGESLPAADTQDGPGYPIGRIAQTRLRLLVLLRALDNDRLRPDRERHRETIFRLKPPANHDPESISYLRWYRVIALADAGSAEEARALACQALAEDARLFGSAKCGGTTTIAGRQYLVIRRFIETFRRELCHPDELGSIGQMLQSPMTLSR